MRKLGCGDFYRPCGRQNLVKVLDDLKIPDVKEVALLNYYFFFPAHEEGPIPGCTNVEAKEFGCFAGDWVCMALLLKKKDATGSKVQSVTHWTKRAGHDLGQSAARSGR